jgi:hypothetical protein
MKRKIIETIVATVTVRRVDERRRRATVRVHHADTRSWVDIDLDWSFQTPLWCADYMASLIPLNCRTVLEPTPGLGNLVRVLRLSGYEVTAPVSDFWIEIDATQRFDAVVMNPPFSARGWEILLRCMELSDHIIVLQPWMVLINSEHRTKMLFDYGLVSVTHLPRRVFPGARVQTCVLEMCRGYCGDTILRDIRSHISRTKPDARSARQSRRWGSACATLGDLERRAIAGRQSSGRDPE